jgi:hypothetical protein
MSESESESETGEIQMYCCLQFSDAVHYGFIKIDTHRIEVEISIRSSLTDGERKEVMDELSKARISSFHPDYFCIIHCPWCGTLSTVIDFDKGVHAGQYGSKEVWER